MRKQTKNLTDILYIAVIVIIVGTLLIMACKASPLEAYQLFFKGIFGTPSSFAEVFVKSCPLILTGLGCAVAFRTGFFNIGAEGQFYVGAIAGAMVVLNLASVPGVVRILLALLAGFFCGGIWALIAAIMKAKFGISEIIVTIMLNYIAIGFLGYAVRSFLMNPEGSVPESAKVDAAAQLPVLISRTRFHAGIVIAVLCVLVVWFFIEKTTLGYEMKVVGFNKRAASCNGISVIKNIILSSFLSGGLAAMAGVIEVLAVQKKLLEGISASCGYTAVLIALIATNKPLGVLAVAILYSAMQVGANSMQRQLGVPSAISSILIGLVVLLILARKIFHWKKSAKTAAGKEA